MASSDTSDTQETKIANWYLLDEPFPSLAFVRVVRLPEGEHFGDGGGVAQEIMNVVSYCCDNCIPHNVYFTLAKDVRDGGVSCLRCIIYPRDSEALAKAKDLSGFNIAAFELGGYVTVGCKAMRVIESL